MRMACRPRRYHRLSGDGILMVRPDAPHFCRVLLIRTCTAKAPAHGRREAARYARLDVLPPRRRRRRQAGAARSSRATSSSVVTWNQIADDARRMAAALVRLGVKPGDRVIQVSENRYEWIVLDLAIHLARGIHVAVHSTLTGPQIAYQIIEQRREAGRRLRARAGAKAGGRGRRSARRTFSICRYDACSEKIGEQPDPPLGRAGRAGQRSRWPGDLEAGRWRSASPTIWPRSSTPRARPASPRA